MASWFSQLRPASFRGVPFAVIGGRIRVGRRSATHEYPYRDTVWVEDLGRAARRIVMVGFVIGDDCIAKRDSLLGACETKGTGELIHPTLGNLTVSCLEAEAEERKEEGRVFEFSFSFIEGGLRLFPGVAPSTASVVSTAGAASDVAALAGFVLRADEALRKGVTVVQQAARTAATWSAMAQKLADDATNLYDIVGTLQGSYGRYFGGANFGFGNTTSALSSTDTSGLIAQGVQSRGNVNTAAAGLNTAAVGLSANAAAENAYGTAAQTLAAALAAACVDPASALRLLAQLADFQPVVDPSSAPIGAAVGEIADASGDLFRRAAIAVLAQASSTYQPSSYDDAAAVRTQVCALIEAEIDIAGDQGEDDVYASLRALRAAVSQDLTTRGADLATVATFTSNQPLPAPVWAQRLYRDPTRADQLVIQANPIHPAFMPTSFKALSS